MSKIKKLLADALIERGVAPAIARYLTDDTDCLGMYAEESAQLDDIDIERVADGLASLVHRHSVTADLISPIEEISPSESSATFQMNDPPLIHRFRAMSPGFAKFLSYAMTVALIALLLAMTAVAVVITSAIIILMIALTVSGILLFIIGLVYGVSQFETFTAAAFYEIGIGLVLSGNAALLTVLLYTVVMSVIPSFTRKCRRIIKDNLVQLRRFRHHPC